MRSFRAGHALGVPGTRRSPTHTPLRVARRATAGMRSLGPATLLLLLHSAACASFVERQGLRHAPTKPLLGSPPVPTPLIALTAKEDDTPRAMGASPPPSGPAGSLVAPPFSWRRILALAANPAILVPFAALAAYIFRLKWLGPSFALSRAAAVQGLLCSLPRATPQQPSAPAPHRCNRPAARTRRTPDVHCAAPRAARGFCSGATSTHRSFFVARPPGAPLP